jgi:ribosomal protein S18 acetylase RimI-like enzyme
LLTGEEPYIQIVALPPNEWQAYRTIRLEALRLEPQAFAATYASSLAKPDEFWFSRLESSAASPLSRLLFARIGDRLVGMVGAMAAEDPGVADIISVYVNAGFRGKGLGRALMSAILDDLRTVESVTTIRLFVRADNEPGVALYRGVGFEIVSTDDLLREDGVPRSEHRMEFRRNGPAELATQLCCSKSPLLRPGSSGDAS